MLTTFALAWAMTALQAAGATSAATAATPAASDGWRVELSLQLVTGTDRGGRFAAWNGDGRGLVEGFVAVGPNMCDLAGGSREPAEGSGAAWRYAVRTLQQSPLEAVVNVEWQRLWANGERVPNAPVASQVLTLRPRAPVVLDVFTPAVPGTCGTRSANLAIALVEARSVGGVGARAAGVVQSAGGGSGGAGGGRGGGRTSGAGSGGVGAGGVGASAGGSSRGVGAVPGTLFETPAPPTHDVELWLVHTLPGGTEQVSRLTAAVSRNVGSYEFPAVPIPTGRGSLAVEVSGKIHVLPSRTTFAAGTGTSAPAQLLVVIDRRVRSAGPPSVDTSGSSGKLIDLPSEKDVISFELPGVSGPVQELLAGHQFSLRVRVTPK